MGRLESVLLAFCGWAVVLQVWAQVHFRYALFTLFPAVITDPRWALWTGRSKALGVTVCSASPLPVAARREERASTKKWEVSAFPLMVLWYVCVQGSLKSIQSKRIHRGKCGNLVRLSSIYFCMWLCVFQLYVWFWESSSLLILIVLIFWLHEEPFLHGRNSPSFQDMLFVLSGASVHRR